MTPAGIEPTTFRFVAQHLNRCATAVPVMLYKETQMMLPRTVKENSYYRLQIKSKFKYTLLPSDTCFCTSRYGNGCSILAVCMFVLHFPTCESHTSGFLEMKRNISNIGNKGNRSNVTDLKKKNHKCARVFM